MKNILITGAGRSSSSLISYLLERSAELNFKVTVGDVTKESALSKTGNNVNASAIQFDVNNAQQRESEITAADIIISLLPPHLHQLMAEDCVRLGKHFLTASYLTPEMKQLDKSAVDKGVLLLNECGLDPGIDHMSAMKCIDDLNKEGAQLTSFKSYTGGLIAPESNDNPWNYKFTWNPRNVILAGQGTAKYIHNNKYKYIPYNRLFTDIESIEVKGLGKFDGYANRDSLAYRKHYGIENIPTILRGTLRNSGFCRAWDVFVQLGLTDDTYKLEHSEVLTYADFVRALLPSKYTNRSLEDSIADFCNLPVDGEAMTKIKWTGLFEDDLIGLKDASPAMILQKLLEQKWALKSNDIDMIVMQHIFEYEKNNKKKTLTSSLIVKGDNSVYTAMAKTVGLPLAIAAVLLLEDKLKLTGVHIPVVPELYVPILKQLSNLGIEFEETVN